MRKKQWIILVSVSVVVSLALCSFGTAGASVIDEKTLDAFVSSAGGHLVSHLGNNTTDIATYGPITPHLNFSFIRLTGGEPLHIHAIEKALQQRILQFILPFQFISVYNTIDFTIVYPRTIPSLPLFKNFNYGTAIGFSGGNLSNLTTVPHQVIVKDFSGVFAMKRGKPLQLSPPSFMFYGYCSEITVIPL